MIGERGKDYNYAARVYKQSALEKQIHDDIKTMTYTLLSQGKRRLRIVKATDVIMGNGEKLIEFDTYPSCKEWSKKYCPAKGKKYAGYIDEYDEENQEWHRPYRVLADSELGVYLEVINLFLGRKMVYPAIY